MCSFSAQERIKVKAIKKILNIDDISKVRTSDNYLYNKLKDIGLEENIDTVFHGVIWPP